MDRIWGSLKIRLFSSLLDFDARLGIGLNSEHAYQTCIVFTQKSVVALRFEQHGCHKSLLISSHSAPILLPLS